MASDHLRNQVLYLLNELSDLYVPYQLSYHFQNRVHVLF